MFGWFGTLAEAVLQLGYPGVLLALIVEGTGLPFPGDAAMAFYGFASAEGRFAWHVVLLVCVAGYMVGAIISYAVGRIMSTVLKYGLAARKISRFVGITPRSMMRTTGLMERFGPLVLVLGRFLPGIRSVSSYAAGLTKMAFSTFFLYTLLGTIFWCATWLALGFFLEENVTQVLRFAQSSLAYVTMALVIAVGVWLFWRRRHRPL